MSVTALLNGTSVGCFSASPPLRCPNSEPSCRAPPRMASSRVRIAVVGDVHDDWNLEQDAKALQFLQADLVLFTGDFGDENVEVVQTVADLLLPKAVILGNHDCWKTHQFSGKRKDNVQLQLECLGEAHVGYKCLDFPALKLSIAGGRPFSGGGDQIFRTRLLSARYGVEDMDSSAKRMYKAASKAPEDHLIIFLAHNGPTGLGAEANDICGVDWVFGGGDHGDPDLAQALSLIKETSRFCIPLVVFGHMHKELACGKGNRKMIVIGDDNTIYLNGAIVPRVKEIGTGQKTRNGSSKDDGRSAIELDSRGTKRAFTLVEIVDGGVDKIAEVWVSVVGDTADLQEEHLLFKSGRQASL